ncbi:MAG: helix-turn-helix domain-containing protein [Thermoplasmataceae archaeon]
MISGSFTVRSKCGLASVAGALDETVLSVYVYPLQENKNYVFSIVNTKHQEELEPLLAKDYISYKIHSANGIIMIQGVKRGHGLMKAIVDNGAIPSFPLMARDELEILNFTSLSDRYPSKLESSLEASNHVEDFFFERVKEEEFVTNLTRRWGLLGAVNLTSTERNLIKSAYKQGFFEWPRIYDLDLMKRDYNLSKPTLLYHMRNAERKIMQAIFG